MTSEFYEAVGKFVIGRREERKLTQRDVARKAGVSIKRVRAIEKGRGTSIEVLEKVLFLFGRKVGVAGLATEMEENLEKKGVALTKRDENFRREVAGLQKDFAFLVEKLQRIDRMIQNYDLK